MIQKSTLSNFLRQSRQGLGLEKQTYVPCVSIGEALALTSRARLNVLEERLRNENKVDVQSSNNNVRKALFAGGVFSAVTIVTYQATGQSDLSFAIAPIVGGIVAAYLVFDEPSLNDSNQTRTSNLPKNSSSYENAMSILDADSKFEKEMLQRYKHLYY